MHFLTKVEKLLDLGPAEKSLVMRELSSHYHELRDELVASGMGAAEAGDEACRRLGDPADVAAQLGPVHNSSTWKSAILAALPFVAAPMLAMLTPTNAQPILRALPLMLFLALMLAGSMRELVSGRRPIWLASWLAASLLAVRGVIWHFFAGPSITFSGVIKADSVSLDALRRSNMIAVTIIAVVLAAAVWGSRKWRIPALLLGLWSIFAATLALGHLSVAPTLAVWSGSLASVALTVLFAWRVFASHRYGSSAQASLFLLTFMTTGGYGMVYGGRPLFTMIMVYTPICTSAMAVICFARVGTSSRKVLAILGSLLIAMACRMAIQLQAYLHGRVVVFVFGSTTFAAMLPFYILMASLILTPFLIEYLRRRRDRLTLAR